VYVLEFNKQFNYAVVADGWNGCMYRCIMGTCMDVTSGCTSLKVPMCWSQMSVFYLLSVHCELKMYN
jgi:hypothetical protein